MTRSEFTFLETDDVIEIHETYEPTKGQDADLSLLDSAVNAPQWVYCYRDDSDIFDLAGAYLFHICMNHSFVDGNKRTASTATIVFLVANGFLEDDFDFMSEDDYLQLTLAIPEHRATEKDAADFLRSRLESAYQERCSDQQAE